MELGGDMQSVFARFSRGLTDVEKIIKSKGLKFQRSDRVGFLSTCPSNIGTSLRCSVHIQLRHLAKVMCLKLKLSFITRIILYHIEKNN